MNRVDENKTKVGNNAILFRIRIRNVIEERGFWLFTGVQSYSICFYISFDKTTKKTLICLCLISNHDFSLSVVRNLLIFHNTRVYRLFMLLIFSRFSTNILTLTYEY